MTMLSISSSKSLIEQFKQAQYQPFVKLRRVKAKPGQFVHVRSRKVDRRDSSGSSASLQRTSLKAEVGDCLAGEDQLEKQGDETKLPAAPTVDAFAESLHKAFISASSLKKKTNKKKLQAECKPSCEGKAKSTHPKTAHNVVSAKVINCGTGVVLTCLSEVSALNDRKASTPSTSSSLSSSHKIPKPQIKDVDKPKPSKSVVKKPTGMLNMNTPKHLHSFVIPKVQASPEKTNVSQDGHIVRVTGLPPSCDDIFIRSLFNGCHTVEIHFTYEQNGQQSGTAYVAFSSDFDQQRALDRNECNITAQDVVVVKASRREMDWVLKRSRPSFQFTTSSDFVVKLSGLPVDCSPDDITHFLKGCKMTEVHYRLSSRGLFDRAAFVELSTADDCQKAIAKNKMCIGKQCIDVCQSSRQVLESVLDTYKSEKSGWTNVIWLRCLPMDGTSNDIRIFLTGCNVGEIHFTTTRDGLRSGECFVEVPTDNDLNLALGKSGRYIGRSSVIVVRSSYGQMRLALRRNSSSHSSSSTGRDRVSTASEKSPSKPVETVAVSEMDDALAEDDDSDEQFVTIDECDIDTEDTDPPVTPAVPITPAVPALSVTSAPSNQSTKRCESNPSVNSDRIRRTSPPSWKNSLSLRRRRRPPRCRRMPPTSRFSDVKQSSTSTLSQPVPVAELKPTKAVPSQTSLLIPPNSIANSHSNSSSIAPKSNNTNPKLPSPTRFSEKLIDSTERNRLLASSTAPAIPFILDGDKPPMQPQSVVQPQPVAAKESKASIVCTEDEWKNLCRVVVNTISSKIEDGMLNATLKQMFEPFGPITRLDYRKHGNISRRKHAVRAIIEFATPDAAHLAILQMSGVRLGYAPIEVSLDREMLPSFPLFQAFKKEAEASNRIYISNINPDVIKCDLTSAFQTVGNVTNCQMSVDPVCPQKNLGYAYIEYETGQMAADAIIIMNLVNFRGLSLRVGLAVTPANVNRGALTPKWSHALSVASKVANSLEHRLMMKRKSRFDSSVPSKFTKTKNITETTVNKTDVDLRPSAPSSSAETVRRSAGDATVDREAERQRVMALVSRVTNMLRTGQIGDITPLDVNIVKRNFSDSSTFRTPATSSDDPALQYRSNANGFQSPNDLPERDGIEHRLLRLSASGSSDGFRSKFAGVSPEGVDQERGSLTDCNVRNNDPCAGQRVSDNMEKFAAPNDDNRRVIFRDRQIFDYEPMDANNPYVASDVDRDRIDACRSRDVDMRSCWSEASRDIDLRSNSQQPLLSDGRISPDFDGRPAGRRRSSVMDLSPKDVVSKLLLDSSTRSSRRVSMIKDPYWQQRPVEDTDSDHRHLGAESDVILPFRNASPLYDESDERHDVDYRFHSAVGRY